MADMNFYDNLDLRYPELAICIDQIDRTNPGTLRFYIPILTPNMNMSQPLDTKIRQTPGNIINKNKVSVDVSSLDVSNYIKIALPRELCAFVGGHFHVESTAEGPIESEIEFSHSGSGSIRGTGTVGPPLTYSVLSATVASIRVQGDETGKGHYKGIMNIVPTKKYRYIPPNSKWIVVFIGGDINKPKIIAPYEQPSWSSQ